MTLCHSLILSLTVCCSMTLSCSFSFSLSFNSFFVYVFIVDGTLTPVQQVFVIILILISLEMVITWFLRWFALDRTLNPVEQQLRLGGVTLLLGALFVSLTAYEWSRLPGDSAIHALVRFIASSIGTLVGECLVWFVFYHFADTCCPCVRLDDGEKSLEDIDAEKEEEARQEKERQKQKQIELKRAKMKKQLDVKGVYREEDEV